MIWLCFAEIHQILKYRLFFDKVSDISGSQLNQRKTNIRCLSDCKPMIYCDYFQKRWKCVEFFSPNNFRENITISNQIRIFEKIKQKASRLAGFSLTFRGRLLIANMILNSQLNLISGVYLPTKFFLKEVRKHIFQFIWVEGRKEVISRRLRHQ